MEVTMRKRILRGVVILAAILTLFGATVASGAFLAGTYAGRITGVQGISLPRGGNMKFRITRRGKVSSFQFSKIYVACADGNVHRTSGHVGGIRAPIVDRVFTIHAQNAYGATLKVKGIIRGSNHARGYLNFKGRMTTNAGTFNCKTGRQFWSARHI
jgi:hypothetical protein